jgi:hypothetical protein
MSLKVHRSSWKSAVNRRRNSLHKRIDTTLQWRDDSPRHRSSITMSAAEDSFSSLPEGQLSKRNTATYQFPNVDTQCGSLVTLPWVMIAEHEMPGRCAGRNREKSKNWSESVQRLHKLLTSRKKPSYHPIIFTVSVNTYNSIKLFIYLFKCLLKSPKFSCNVLCGWGRGKPIFRFCWECHATGG